MNCWIGQALIAENVNHSSTLDLLRHCNTLNYHPIATLKFAYHLLLNTTNQHSNQIDLFNLAIDNMHIYIKKKTNDPLALNLLGCLHERNNHKKVAFGLFNKALQHSFSSTDYIKNCIKINHLRNAAYFKRPEELNIDEELYKSDWPVSVYLCLANILHHNYQDAYSCLNHALSLVDSGSYVYFLIDSLKYLLLEKLNKVPEMSFNYEMMQTNEPLRTVFVANSMLSRNYSPVLKEIIMMMSLLPKLIDMMLISSFSVDASINFAKDFQSLPQTWIKQCLDYLIDREQDAKDDLKEYNRIYRNFITCSDIKAKQIVGYHLIISLNLIDSIKEDCLEQCVISAQTAYLMMPFDSIIRRLFELILKIKSKELNCKSLFDELGLPKNDLLVFLLDLLQ